MDVCRLLLIFAGIVSASGRFFDVPLDANDQFHLYWSLVDEDVLFELQANKIDSPSWLAIGFSDRGRLENADLCILWFDSKRKNHFQDSWTDDKGIVHVDSKQNCHLMGLKSGSGFLRFAYKRSLDTCDARDYHLEKGTVHVVYATGDGPIPSISGLSLLSLSKKSGFQRTRILKFVGDPPTLGKDVHSITVHNYKTKVPSVETTYWCSTHKLPAIFKKKHHIVKYENAVQNGSESLVHHMEVFHCDVPSDQHLPSWDGSCQDPKKPTVLENRCKKVLAAWAMGALPIAYPAEAGLPIGGNNYSFYVVLEVHYNNPERRKGLVDSSGIRLFFTNKLRKVDSGILEVGLVYSDQNSFPPFQKHFRTSGFCTAKCTQASLPREGITVFAIQPHTHLTGTAVWTTHVSREGEALEEIDRDDHFSTHFQDIRLLERRSRIFPGEAIINTCIFDTNDRNKTTTGGLAITQEMCISYIHYFPKTDLEVCKSLADSKSLRHFFNYMRRVKGEKTKDGVAFSRNYDLVNWTKPENVRLLRDLLDYGPIQMDCSKSNGDRFPGRWDGNEPPIVLFPLPKPVRNCSAHRVRRHQIN